jgi:hypothetical protein
MNIIHNRQSNIENQSETQQRSHSRERSRTMARQARTFSICSPVTKNAAFTINILMRQFVLQEVYFIMPFQCVSNTLRIEISCIAFTQPMKKLKLPQLIYFKFNEKISIANS